MKPELEEALAHWETGELSREELVRRFPDEDVVGVLDTVERMRAAADVPTPDAAAAWEAVRDHLPARLDDRRRGGSKTIRLLAAAMIAMLLMGATAYALVPSVQRAIDDAVHVFIGTADRPLRQSDPAPDAGDPPTKRTGEAPSTANGSEPPGDDQSGQDPDGDSDDGSDGEGTIGEESGSGSGSDDGDTGGDQGSSDDEGTADEDAGTGSEEAAGDDQGSADEGSASEDAGTGSEE